LENDTLFWHGDQVWPERIALLHEYAHLRRLILWGGSVTADRLRGLGALGHLESLAIGECPVDDGLWTHVAPLTRLSFLNLSYTLVSRGFRQLAGLAVAELRLEGCTRVDDASLAELERWTALERIDVRGTAVTQEGLERLRCSLPSCNVLAA
jgi:hypothetical protein